MKPYFILGFGLAVGLGFLLVNPWAFVHYLFLLVVATVIAVIIILASLIGKTKEWKKALLTLAIGYTAALTSYCVQSYCASKFSNKRNSVLLALYNYRNRYNNFPKSVKELSIDLSAIRGRYVPDSGLKYFKLCTKDYYGMPWIFNSKDSIWRR